jgi:hypothetical protein
MFDITYEFLSKFLFEKKFHSHRSQLLVGLYQILSLCVHTTITLCTKTTYSHLGHKERQYKYNDNNLNNLLGKFAYVKIKSNIN